MNYLFTNFRSFFEEIDPSLDKSVSDNSSHDNPTGVDYFDTLEDEFGINWKSLRKIFGSEPWISTHFLLGKPDKEVAYKISAWEIEPSSISEKGAMIRVKPTIGGNRSYINGMLNKSKPDSDYYWLSKSDLVKFLTTGWIPPAAPDAGSGGGDMGMGGGIA